MPRRGEYQYDAELLRTMWMDGKTHKEIAAALGCSEVYVSDLRRQHNLPLRRRKQAPPVDYEPTQETIAAEAHAIRQRNLAEMRESPRGHTSETSAIRVYTWSNAAFRVVS